jgi:hypothetical protein
MQCRLFAGKLANLVPKDISLRFGVTARTDVEPFGMGNASYFVAAVMSPDAVRFWIERNGFRQVQLLAD